MKNEGKGQCAEAFGGNVSGGGHLTDIRKRGEESPQGTVRNRTCSKERRELKMGGLKRWNRVWGQEYGCLVPGAMVTTYRNAVLWQPGFWHGLRERQGGWGLRKRRSRGTLQSRENVRKNWAKRKA